MKRRLWITIITAIVFGIGACTIISSKNYINNITMVLVTSSVPNSIRVEVDKDAGLYYRETMNMELPLGCKIENVYTQAGDMLNPGDPILQLREADLQITYLKLQMEADALRKHTGLADEEEILDEDCDAEKELAYWQLQLVKEKMIILEKLIAEQGIVKTDLNCCVIRQDYAGGLITSEELLVTLGLTEAGCYVEWFMSPDQYKTFSYGTADIHGQKISLTLVAPIYEKELYLFRTYLPDIKECVHGERIGIRLFYISGEYTAVIPKQCIWYEQDGSTYVYQVATRNRIFGKESYVRKTGVTIEEQDKMNVAIKAALKDVVSHSSKELEDLMAVAVVSPVEEVIPR